MENSRNIDAYWGAIHNKRQTFFFQPEEAIFSSDFNHSRHTIVFRIRQSCKFRRIRDTTPPANLDKKKFSEKKNFKKLITQTSQLIESNFLFIIFIKFY